MSAYLFKSLSGATAVGPGSVLTFDQPRGYRSGSLQVSFTGAPSNVAVDLEGSLDGVNWSSLMTWSGGNPSGAIISSGVFPVIALRTNLKTLTGGTSPTVDAIFGLAPSE